MGRKADPSYVQAVRLRKSGGGCDTSLKTAKVQDTGIARKLARWILRELVSKADAEAEAERIDAAADLRAKRKDLKARETALEAALRQAVPR